MAELGFGVESQADLVACSCHVSSGVWRDGGCIQSGLLRSET